MLTTKFNQTIRSLISHFSACRARLQSLIYDNSYDIYDKELLKVKPGKGAKIMFWIAISIALSWTEELIVVAVQAILK